MQGSFPRIFPVSSPNSSYSFPPGMQELAVQHFTKMNKVKMEGERPDWIKEQRGYRKLGNGHQGIKVKK